ncbi:hypothetical protein ABID56_001476 [Alkalibacillus flavidus]|uniref:Uncharacterized protein n=1 Tax=Alkalibacillus flavidus TaxID=546021 RepID=A0ABV2KXU7_9BACI
MKVFVYPCFHPFGFQVMEYYLYAGHDVVGHDELETDEAWHYYAMVARHAKFTFVEDDGRDYEPFHEAICIGETCPVEADRVSVITLDLEQ